MSLLESIIDDTSDLPPRLVVYGVAGLGKSTFAASAPDVIFCQLEDGLRQIKTKKLPICTTFEQFMDQLRALYSDKHNFKTLAVDTVDALETLIFKQVCNDQRVNAIDEIGYGKGPGFALVYWQQVIEALNAINKDRQMAIILIAHPLIKRFDSPQTASYDRYMPRLNEKAAAKLVEWSDCTFFANYKVFVTKEEVGFNKEISHGITAGDPVLYTREKPAFIAKNRYSLPEEIPMPKIGGWDSFVNAIPATAQIQEIEKPVVKTHTSTKGAANV